MECKSNEKLQNPIPRTPNMEYGSVQKPHIVHSTRSNMECAIYIEKHRTVYKQHAWRYQIPIEDGPG